MDSGVDSEVVFNTGAHEEDVEDQREKTTPDSRIPPTPITQCDMDVIIRGWEEKFSRMSECLREVQITSERASSDMCLVGQEAREQSAEHDRRLSNFLQKFDEIDALRASTPRRHPTFGFQPSPVVREEVSQPPSSLPHFESARTAEDRDDQRNSLPHFESARTAEDRDDQRNSLPHVRSARTGEHSSTRAPEITTMTGTRAPEITTMTGTRTPRSQTTRCRTLVVRAKRITCCSVTRTPGSTMVETRAPYNFVLIATGIRQTTTMTPRFHARYRVRKCPRSMVLTLLNLGLGSYSSRPSRAIRAGQQENGSSAWSPRSQDRPQTCSLA